ncbi:PAP1-domain-containing protein [Hortaea werneckii]|nr:PAP1-domain-containing protein [Hortaea werneckii]
MASEQLADNMRQPEHLGPTFGSTSRQPTIGQQLSRATPHLSHKQQDLLLAALNSQLDKTKQQPIHHAHYEEVSSETATHHSSFVSAQPLQPTMNGDSANGLYISPQDAALDNLSGDFTPDLDYFDGDNFDFDNADLGGEMIGALPGGEGNEKRKSPDERDEFDETEPKRQETLDGEKGSKKPGRKPLMSEPTTKRKAQNRAAQRAFRERKEKHLKDLETKVSELTKSSEADKHENGLLKAQVERLQVELREYRKQLSLNGSTGGARSSPPLNAYTGQNNRSMKGPSVGNDSFQFDFPKFGALPGSAIFGSNQQPRQSNANGVMNRTSASPPAMRQSPSAMTGGPAGLPSQPKRENSGSSHHMSPAIGSPSNTGVQNKLSAPSYADAMPSVGYSSANNMHGFASTLPQMGGDNSFGDLFSPGLLKTANMGSNNYFDNRQQPQHLTGGNKPQQSSHDSYSGGESTAGLNRVFQFNSGSSASDSASPSTSSGSQWNGNGPNSSCGTSPEPSHGSPANKDQAPGSVNDKANSHKGSNASDQQSVAQHDQPNTNSGITFTGNNFDFGMPSNDSFDPLLYGDYRDNRDAVGNNDFSTAFFDDALNPGPFDYGSPSNLFGILQSPQQSNATLPSNLQGAKAPTPSRNLMAEVEKTRDGGDEDLGLPATQPKTERSGGKLISCNNIWNQLQSNPDFQNGTFDLDSLCSELRAKAKCSESGVMVDQDHVDATLRKLGKQDDTGKFVPANGPMPSDVPHLMFEQDSWDNVLQRMGGGNNMGF